MPAFLRLAPLLLLAGCIPGKAPAPARTPPPHPTAPAPAPAPVPPPPIAAPPAVAVPEPPAPPPAWQAKTVAPNAVEVPNSTYAVARGDTLRRIAEKTGAGSEAIARENRLAPPFVIRAGQKLRIPGGRYHKVGKGESGIAIARAYGVDWSRVATMNLLAEPYILREGQRLLLPSSRDVATMSIEERAQAFRLDIDDLITGGEPALATNAALARPTPAPSAAVPATVPVAEPNRFAGRFEWPLTGTILRRFGNLGGGQQNDGINIAATSGAPILAAADGVVAYVGTEVAVYGGLVLIRHGDGWITAYGHAQDLLVTRGQAVKKGQVIGHAGATGYAAEPQLHFEIRQNRKPMNPLDLLPKRG